MNMKKHFAALMVCAASPLCATIAMAADYDPPIYVEESPEYKPVEVGTGWYIRGDLSYSVATEMGDISYRVAPAETTFDNRFATTDLDSNFGGGVGFGYHFNDYFRADVTGDIMKTDFNGTTTGAAPCDGGLVGTTCRSEDVNSVYTMSYLANGYVDLGTFSKITPYVGAGAGISSVKWEGLTGTNYCVDGTAVCTSTDPVSTDSYASAKDWRFTYAFMAGVAYDISPSMKLDLGYRYKHVDGGDNFGWNAAAVAAGATGVQGIDDGYNLHEVKVGFRYDLY